MPRLTAWLVDGRGLALLAVPIVLIVGSHAARQAIAPDGSIDLHAYWYAGHFLRQGDNPYTAFVRGDEPRRPPGYLDGPSRPGVAVRQGDLSVTPSNAAPVTLALAPFAWLTWPTARAAWLLTNLALAVIVPLLILRLLPHRDGLPRRARAGFVVGFLLLQGTRITVWVGQTTLLVLALALAALLVRHRRPLWSGVLLGIALSKYSLIAPTWLFLVAIRRYRVAVVAAAVQCVALAGVAALGRGGVRATLSAYGALGRLHAGLPGIHLVGVAPEVPWVGAACAVAVTVAVAAVLWRHRMRWRGTGPHPAAADAAEPRRGTHPSRQGGALTLGELHGLVVLVLWGLLVVYHRAYDALAAYAFVALVLDGLTSPDDPWGLRSRGRAALAAFTVGVFVVLALPPSVAAVALPPAAMQVWYRVAGLFTTATIAAALLVTLALVARLSPRTGAGPDHRCAARVPSPSGRPCPIPGAEPMLAAVLPNPGGER